MNGKNDAICFEPGIARREGGGNRFVKNKCVTLRNNMGDNLPAVCFRKDRPVDAVYKQGGQGEEYRGVSYTLNTIDRHAVCYAVEGNVADRNAGQNGKGWCEGVAPSLSTQDRHAVCFQQNQREEVRNMGETAGCLNADSGMHNTNYVWFRKACKPSADGKGERWEQSDQSNTLNGFEFHSDVRTPEAVCYIIDPLSSNSMKSSNPHSGIHPTDVCKCLDTQCLNPSCNQGGVIVCYVPNGNHCGAYLPTDVSATLETKYHYGSGGDAALVVEKRHE